MTDSDLIDKAGGTCAIARFCDVTPAVVTNWKRRGIPTGWRKYLATEKPAIFGAPEADVQQPQGAIA